MLRTVKNLKSIMQTGQEMLRMVKSYWDDVPQKHLNNSLVSWHRFVSDLPYIKDPVGIESVARPKILLTDNPEYRDCDDKSILIACWLYAHHIPFRFLAVSYQKDKEVCHAVVQTLDDDENPFIIDATYPNTSWPRDRNFYNETPITEWVQ